MNKRPRPTTPPDAAPEKAAPGNRNRILEAAAKIIREEGVTSASLSSISREAKIAKGTLHYYYRSKSDLLFDLAEQQASELSGRFLGMANDGGVDMESAIGDLVAEILTRGSNNLLIHLMMEGATGNSDLKEKFRRLYREWTTTIELGLRRMGGESVPAGIPEIILASLIGLLFNGVVDGRKIDPATFVGFISRGAGLARTKGRKT